MVQFLPFSFSVAPISYTLMLTQFVGATTFNQDLCSWGRQLESFSESADVDTLGMFVSTACPLTSDPDPSNPASGSFCRRCTAL